MRNAAVLAVLVVAALAGATHAVEAKGGDAAATMQYLAPYAAHADVAPYIVEAAVGNGYDPASWPAGAPALDAVVWQNATFAQALRPLHALGVADKAPPDLVATVLAGFRDGQFGNPGLRNDDAWAILALLAAGVHDSRVDDAAAQLARQQDPSGGWSWQLAAEPDTDSTGMALEALAAAGALDPAAAQAAAAWLMERRDAAGGFADAPGHGANCDSSVWAVRGLWATGSPVPENAWSYLGSLRGDDGSFAYVMGQPANVLCTAEVATLLGLAAARGAGPWAEPNDVGVPGPEASIILVGLASAAVVSLRKQQKPR